MTQSQRTAKIAVCDFFIARSPNRAEWVIKKLALMGYGERLFEGE